MNMLRVMLSLLVLVFAGINSISVVQAQALGDEVESEFTVQELGEAARKRHIQVRPYDRRPDLFGALYKYDGVAVQIHNEMNWWWIKDDALKDLINSKTINDSQKLKQMVPFRIEAADGTPYVAMAVVIEQVIKSGHRDLRLIMPETSNLNARVVDYKVPVSSRSPRLKKGNTFANAEQWDKSERASAQDNQKQQKQPEKQADEDALVNVKKGPPPMVVVMKMATKNADGFIMIESDGEWDMRTTLRELSNMKLQRIKELAGDREVRVILQPAQMCEWGDVLWALELLQKHAKGTSVRLGIPTRE